MSNKQQKPTDVAPAQDEPVVETPVQEPVVEAPPVEEPKVEEPVIEPAPEEPAPVAVELTPAGEKYFADVKRVIPAQHMDGDPLGDLPLQSR